jgi:hypothetical protein
MGMMNELIYDGEKLSAEETTRLALKAKECQESKELLVRSFMGYIDKYANIIKGNISLDHDNYDTRQFKNLFISTANLAFYSSARLTLLMQSLFAITDIKDLRQDIVFDFLTAINKYNKVKAKSGFLPYVTQYIRWKAKDRVVAAFTNPLNNTNWTARPLKGDSDFRGTEINPIELPHLQKVEEPSMYEGLSEITLEWVESCDDPLFRDLSRYSRYLLYLRYKCDQTFDDMAEALQRSPRTVSDQFKRTILRLRLMAHRDGALDDESLLDDVLDLEDEE